MSLGIPVSPCRRNTTAKCHNFGVIPSAQSPTKIRDGWHEHPVPHTLVAVSGAAGAGQQRKGDEQEDQEPLEEEGPEKLGAKGVLQMIAMVMVLGVAAVCGYFITVELMPSRMSPNTVMNKAHDAFLADPDVSTGVLLCRVPTTHGRRPLSLVGGVSVFSLRLMVRVGWTACTIQSRVLLSQRRREAMDVAGL